MKSQGLKFVLPHSIEDDSRYLRLKDQLGYEGEGIYWAAYRTIRKGGGQYPKQLLIDQLKCHRTPARRIRHVLEDFDLFEVNQAGMIGIASIASPPKETKEDPRQTRIEFDVI